MARGLERADYRLLAALAALALALILGGWARWGNVTIDCGREMYVPAVLSQGQVLYRDVWYLYGPLAPYFNSLLFRVFGVHLTPLYLAGSLAAVICAYGVYRFALYFAHRVVAFAAAFIVLIQSFCGGIFNYPLPYSYAAVYGSAIALLFLLTAMRSAFEPSPGRLVLAGVLAALALHLKTEFGMACFGTLAVLHVGLALRARSWRALFRNSVTLAPGLLIVVLVAAWMISLGGVEFITQENFMSWPTSYFMRTYGEHWLRVTGYDLSPQTVTRYLAKTGLFVIFWLGFQLVWSRLARLRRYWRAAFLVTAGAACVGLAAFRPDQFEWLAFRLLFLDQMVLVVALCAIPAGVLAYRRAWSPQSLALLVACCFGPLLAFRILFRMLPAAYPIYYNGAVLAVFLALLIWLALGEKALRGAEHRGMALALALLFCAFVVWEIAFWQIRNPFLALWDDRQLYRTDRGDVYLKRRILPAWLQAVEFMKQAASRGEIVMSLPEDTALYYFAGVQCPTRLFAFTPGALVPGKMTQETIAQMERAPVKYLIVSNRSFPEYGVPVFGVDFDLELGDYIRSRYKPVIQFDSSPDPLAWKASVWERMAQSGRGSGQ